MYRVEQAAEAHSWVVVDENGMIVCQTQSEQVAIAEACRLEENRERQQDKQELAAQRNRQQGGELPSEQ